MHPKSINKNELIPWIEREKECIDTLYNLDFSQEKTKTMYLQKLIEAERMLVDGGYYPGITRSKLAQFIYSKLLDNKIEFPRGDSYYNLFEEDERRGYGTIFNSLSVKSHPPHEFNNSGSCPCGALQWNGVIYLPEPAQDAPTETEQDRIKELADPTEYPSTHYILLTQKNAIEYVKLCREILSKYFDKANPKETTEYKPVIDAAIKDAKTKIKKEKAIFAKIKLARNYADSRKKVTDWEKLKAHILDVSTYNISKVAKMLRITDKQATKTIKDERRKKEIVDNVRWFETIQIKAPRKLKKGEMFTWKIQNWYNEQIIRKNIGLTLKQPFA